MAPATGKPTVHRRRIERAQASSELGMDCQRLFADGALGGIACFLAPRSSSAADRHPDSEALIVLAGEGIAECAGERYRLAPWDVLLMPGEVAHAMHNEADEPLVWLAFYWLWPDDTGGAAEQRSGVGA